MTLEETKEVIAHVRSLVKFKRHANGLPLRALARQCGVSIATLSRFDRGHSLDAETFLLLVEWLQPTVQSPPRKRQS